MTTKKPQPSLGEVLSRWRASAGLTQEQASEEVGVSQATWSRWERDEAMPSADDLRRIVLAASGALRPSVLVAAADPALRVAG